LRDFLRKLLFMVDFVNNVRSFVNYVIFHELCDRMRFEVDCVKLQHRIISEGLTLVMVNNVLLVKDRRLLFFRFDLVSDLTKFLSDLHCIRNALYKGA